MNAILSRLPDWDVVARAAVEIALMFVIIYAILRFLQGTRGAGILRGLAFFLVVVPVTVLLVVRKLELRALDWLITDVLPISIIPIVVLFQPELRRALVRLGQYPLFGLFARSRVTVTREIVEAASVLSRQRIGGLIVVERDVGLSALTEGGVPLNADISSELLTTLFWPGSPLHDGAVVIHEQRVSAAGCLLPLTENPSVAKTLGTRHRAAIGVTEESDAIAVVVSEETGQISVAVRGEMSRDLDREALQHVLDTLFAETRTASATSELAKSS
ncbi:MAG: TIGR00159 family protein [Planctomycetes bacterium]|nr:TIGR00159 family protein [Planctomycetota bacterium]